MQYPLSDAAYDVVSIIYQKSKALEAYEKFKKDVAADAELVGIIDEICRDDNKHVLQLKAQLGRLMMEPNVERPVLDKPMD